MRGIFRSCRRSSRVPCGGTLLRPGPPLIQHTAAVVQLADELVRATIAGGGLLELTAAAAQPTSPVSSCSTAAAARPPS
jgi:hypothetical protein